MFGRSKKYRIPPHLLPVVHGLKEFKDPATQAHIKLKDGREFTIWIWYPDRIWAIRGFTYLPFAGKDIEEIYQTEDDLRVTPRDPQMMFLDDWAGFQILSLTRWRLKLRELSEWIRGKRGANRQSGN